MWESVLRLQDKLIAYRITIKSQLYYSMVNKSIPISDIWQFCLFSVKMGKDHSKQTYSMSSETPTSEVELLVHFLIFQLSSF